MWVLEELGAWLTCLATFTDCVGLPSVLIGFACKWLSRGRGLLAIDSCSLWTESWRELGTLTSALLPGSQLLGVAYRTMNSSWASG